jgi:hypothetical protein
MAKREVDKRKTAKALRKLRRAAERATGEGGPGLTPWEQDFIEGVTQRLETFGSAFRDPGKGGLKEALSQRQTRIARVLDKKSRKGKTTPEESAREAKMRPSQGSSLKRKTPLRSQRKSYARPRICNLEDDMPPKSTPVLTPAEKRAALRVISGGKPGGSAKGGDR